MNKTLRQSACILLALSIAVSTALVDWRERLRAFALKASIITGELVIVCCCLWEAGFLHLVSGGRISSANTLYDQFYRYDPVDIAGGSVTFLRFSVGDAAMALLCAVMVWVTTKFTIGMAAERLSGMNVLKRVKHHP